MSKVIVLLSTFNGSKYIADQLDSILKQTYHNIKIVVRDDGSSDGTLSILEKFEIEFPSKVSILRGPNIGVISSFFALLKCADKDADFFCFCDQDDIWLSDKVERSLIFFNKKKSPQMYFSSTNLVDENLNYLKVWPHILKRPPSFFNALVQNVAVGTTIMFNKATLNLITDKNVRATDIIMHDWWLYLCVSAFGEVFYDENPTILYRQHSSNVIGGNKDWISTLKKKWRSFIRHRGQKMLVRQAREFKKNYGSNMKGDKLVQLDLFISERKGLKKRINYLNQCNLYRQSKVEQFLLKILILLGHI